MDDLAVAIEAARAGAEVVRGRAGGALVRHDKGGGDFATDVDLDAEAAIRRVIAAHRPDDAFEGEESGAAGGTTGRTWLVDPLCGTRNFAAGTGPVAVNVALRDGPVEVAAAVADPLGGTLFWSAGARVGATVGGDDCPLVPTAESRLVDVNLDAPDGSPPAWTLALLGDPAFWAAYGGRVASSSMALAWVASGRRAAYLTDGDVRDSVHFAAGIAVCRSAGCTVTDLAGDAVGWGPGLLVAADAVTHGHLLDLVRVARS